MGSKVLVTEDAHATRMTTGVAKRALRAPVPADHDTKAEPTLIGRSPAMLAIHRMLGRLTATDLPVMIFGESGTGKELVASALHSYGKRRSGPFVAIDMAAIPRRLIESELFGYEKSTCAGARLRNVSRLEQAQGGTLFLGEIGNMPMQAQARLLWELREAEVTAVGARGPMRTDVRIVASTRQDIVQLIRQGQFRQDLFYRLNVALLRLPPLREPPTFQRSYVISPRSRRARDCR